MLHVTIDPVATELTIHFHRPVPAEAEAHPAFASFLEGLSPTRAAGGLITAIEVGLEQWLALMGERVAANQFRHHDVLLRNAFAGQGIKQDERLHIDFHQKTFDTPQRNWLFILNQGAFNEWVLNRINWSLAPTYRLVAPFPLHVDIETASTCNMNCPMCYRDMLDETGQMDMELFTKIVDECERNGVYSVRLSWRGEALTHPRAKEMIAYAAKRIPNVSFLTNAFYVEQDVADCLIENGVSYVAISFDGIESIYEAIRAPAKFQENRDRVKFLKDRREQAGKTRPQIRLCTIWPAVRENPEAYTNAMGPVSDYMVCNPYINFKGEMKLKPDFICQYPWQRLVVHFDGKTQTCTGWNAHDIILGNAGETTLEAMWHSDRLNEVRDVHANGERMTLKACAECRHGSEGDGELDIFKIIDRKY